MRDRKPEGLSQSNLAIFALLWSISECPSLDIDTRRCYGLIVQIRREVDRIG